MPIFWLYHAPNTIQELLSPTLSVAEVQYVSSFLHSSSHPTPPSHLPQSYSTPTLPVRSLGRQLGEKERPSVLRLSRLPFAVNPTARAGFKKKKKSG